MTIEFEVSAVIEATAKQLYDAWLNSDAHSQMTGGSAEVNATPGAAFTAWDGYISGRNIELTEDKRIVQSWRTTEFSEEEPDSHLEIKFTPEESGTRVTILHGGLPPHGMQYKSGWIESYFIPMKAYFEHPD